MKVKIIEESVTDTPDILNDAIAEIGSALNLKFGDTPFVPNSDDTTSAYVEVSDSTEEELKSHISKSLKKYNFYNKSYVGYKHWIFRVSDNVRADVALYPESDGTCTVVCRVSMSPKRNSSSPITEDINSDEPKEEISKETDNYIDNTPIDEVEGFVAEVKERFPEAEVEYDGDTHAIRILLP